MSEPSSIKDLIDMKECYAKKVKNFGEKALKEEFKRFFAETPEIESVRWTAYTPGFNDGDPCYFTIGEVMYRTPQNAKIAEGEAEAEDDDWEGEGDGYHCAYFYRDEECGISKEAQDKLKKIEKLINEADDVLEMVFGDGVEVTATRESITTREYDCGY